MTDQNVTVLHDRRKGDKPVAPIAQECRLEQFTGYAASDDGMDCVLRTVTDKGIERLRKALGPSTTVTQ